MKKLFIPMTVLVIGLTLFLACGEVGMEDKIEVNIIESLEDLPEYPILIMHVIQREFIQREYSKLHQGSLNKIASDIEIEMNTPEYDNYIERRLIELFPDKSYKGMMSDIRVLIDEKMDDYEVYEGKLPDEYINEYEAYSTLEKEIAYMNMTDEEIADFREIEKFVDHENPLQLDDLLPLTEYSITKPAFGTVIDWTIAAVAVGYSVWRILQCRDRALQKQEEFFHGQTNSGMIGDAFRHVYVSMLLRRYITRPGSFIFMSFLYEFIISPNSFIGDTAMDIHNNYVGRVSKYSYFRGDFFKDLNNWEFWALRVKTYINSDFNSYYMEDWEDGSLSDFEILNQAVHVPNSKYIYYSDGD